MDTFGRHFLVEYHGCSFDVLNNPDAIEGLMRYAAEQAGTTIVTSTFHPFTPQGVSGVVVISESHLSIHTWPEVGYAAVDFYTCGDGQPEAAHEVLRAGLEAERCEVMVVHRGTYPPKPSLQVQTHYSEEAAKPVRVWGGIESLGEIKDAALARTGGEPQ